MDKLILADCDGVFLHWEWSFDAWAARHGYKKVKEGRYEISECYGITSAKADELTAMFHETVFAGNMPPLRDAIKYVKKLHEDHGCIFHIITSIGNQPEIVRARETNLFKVFGESPFHRITCLDPELSKRVELGQYRNSDLIWLEDSVSNFNLGQQLGLRSVLVDQHYNAAANINQYFRLTYWKEFYERITNGYYEDYWRHSRDGE